MTVPELISDVLGQIRNGFYEGMDHAFFRDRTALMRAISRFGYEFEQRGWEIEAQQVRDCLLELLRNIKKAGSDIRYLPVYLDGAVRRFIGMRAEEFSAEQKRIGRHVARAVSKVTPVVVVEPKTCEVLSFVYRDLNARRRRTGAQRQGRQLTLL